jgi:phospholipid transport system transporter-binding protein
LNKPSKHKPGAQSKVAEIHADGASNKGGFKVSGVLNFDTVPAMMKNAKRLLSSAESATIDFSQVESCNSAGLAVVLEMARIMRQQNKSICFVSLPEQIRTFARAYSVEKELEEAGLLC